MLAVVVELQLREPEQIPPPLLVGHPAQLLPAAVAADHPLRDAEFRGHLPLRDLLNHRPLVDLHISRRRGPPLGGLLPFSDAGPDFCLQTGSGVFRIIQFPIAIHVGGERVPTP